MKEFVSVTQWRNRMHRHLIAGALACLGSNLFGQNLDNTVNQTQGELNKVQSTLQNGIQNSRDTVDQGQNMQAGQSSNQGWNRNAIQNSSSIQNGARMQSGGSVASDNLQSTQSTQNSGPVYMLRYDVNGREFICVNGRPVYFDNVNSVSAQGNPGNQNQYRAGYGNYDLKNGQNNQSQQQNSRSGLESRGFDNNSFGVEQSNSRETNLRNSEKGVDSSGQIQTGSDKQNDSQVIRNKTNSRTDFNANSDSTKPSAIPSAEVPPKF